MRALIGQLRVALIDMRGDLRRFAILLACLALGVGTIAMVGAVGAALQAALDRDARVMLGGDLEANLTFRGATPEERALFASLGTMSEVIESAGRAKFGDQGAFLVLRGVDAAYPLVGSVTVGGADAPLPDLLAERDGHFGIVIDDLFLQRTGAKIGDTVEVGEATLQIRGTRENLPDHVTQAVQLGIPALVSIEGLEATGVLKPGAIHRYRYKILLAGDFESATAAIRAATPDAGWSIRSPRDATDDLARFFDIFQRFLTIVGLSALLVGGVGVSNAVSAYITDRQRSIATMRSIGATDGRILFHFLTQVMVLTLIGIVLGLILGALLTLVALPILGNLLGISLSPTVDWRSLGYATGFGLLIGFAFGYLPLRRAQAMRPALLFRSVGAAAEGGLHLRDLLRPGVSIPILVAMAGTIALAVLVTNRPLLVTWYAIGVVVAFAVLRAAGWLIQRILKLVPPLPSATMRNAIKSIYRPGAPAPVVILSLGLGLSLLLLIALIDNNLRYRLHSQNLEDAPTFIFIDLFEDEVAELKDMSAGDPRIVEFETMPMVNANILSANGVPADQLGEAPEEMREMLAAGDFPITFSPSVPEGSKIVAGEWWPADYSGPPLLSIFDELADAFGLKLGDRMVFRVFGEEYSATIASLRDFEWRGGAINFAFVFSPGSLADFPVGYLGLMKTRKEATDAVQETLVAEHSTITFFAIGDALDAIGSVINTVSNAVAIIGGLAVVSGLLVLAGAMAAGRRQREADAVVSKVLGATRGDVILGYLIEYGLLGALSALLAVVLGIVGAWGFVTQVLELDFSVDPLLLVTVTASSIVLTIAVGAATTWSALSVRPAPFLRIE